MTDNSPAWRGLLHLLAMAWDPQLPGQDTPIPWPDVLALARSQEVTHLLYLPAARLGSDVPDAAFSRLREAYLTAGALNSLRFRELQAVQGILAPLDVPLLLLKGAALAETLYQNLALRPMGDLDLAVPHDRAAECRAALLAEGYRLNEIEERPGSHLLHRGQEAYIPPPPFRSPVGLHWHPLDMPYYLKRVPVDWLWNNTGTHQVNGFRVQALTAEANLLYLPAHVCLHHRLQGLPWLVDLAWLVHQEGERVDWPEIVSEARRLELVLALRATFDRLAGLWPSLVLDEPRRLLAALQPGAGEQRIFRLLTTEPRTAFLDFGSDIAGLPDLSSRVRFVLANTFPQGSYMRRRYPVGRPWPLPFWYAYRLGDGAAKSARTLAQIVRMAR